MLSRFPKSEKVASILPTYKGKGDKDDLSSYRPISNLTFISKVIELTIKEQLCKYLYDNDILPKEQSAYRKDHSTETAMLAMLNDFLISMDDKKVGILIMLDLSAAFDTVNHEQLLIDLYNVGLRGRVLDWFQNYLYHRPVYVKLNNSRSEMKILTSGVPQGSVLGPILFCLYTRKLANILRRHMIKFKLYADDCQMYLEFGNVRDIRVVESKISNVNTEVKKWMTMKYLKLNEEKTVYMYIGKDELVKSLPNVLEICEKTIKLEKVTKDLGVHIDENLRFDDQISETVRICNYQLRKIASIKKYLTRKSREKLIHNYVLSKIDYCNSLYYNLPKKVLRPLQMVMNKAARVVTDTRRRDHITPILINLHWLPVIARIEYKIDLITYKALKTKYPKYLGELLQLVNQQSHRNIEVRDTLKLVEPRFNSSTIGLRAFKISAPILFNRLPSRLKSCTSVDTFKKHLKTFLFEKSYDLENQTTNDDYKIH